jgi:RNA polymerase sigma-70 factor (ECF subfamily)
MTEQELITRLKSGDEAAFKEIITLYRNKVIRNCYRFLNNFHDAEDVAQEVFIEVYYSISKFRENSLFSTWIFKISVNKSIDFIRKKNRKKRFANLVSIFDLSVQDKTVHNSPTPHQVYESSERYEAVLKAIEKLPENLRTALILRRLEELSVKEIAEIMDTTVPAVESLVNRAKKKLQEILIKNEGFENSYRQKRRVNKLGGAYEK